ncbi:putative RING-H2 finger protein ATL1 [Iris pallida]|uniref:RING-type E3 ubiquitin transferase n=1 Tax=Iris pallida TaxID=29817 RepID=A0AAX6E3U4_IRIPA|nr:putative RING-H2 finger protein ATL1 [Iris pallida]
MTDIAQHQMAHQNIHNNLHPFCQYTIPPPPPSPPPPPPLSLHASSDSTSFPILAISIVGMLTTAILLLSYYVFVIKCCLNWHHSDILHRLSRSRRQHHLIDDRLRSSYSGASGEGDGLDETTIQAIRTLRFRNTDSSAPFRDCAVCLNEFQVEEKIKMLPNCYHVFHIDCIDTWLQNHSNCPLCRADITTHSVLATAQAPNFDWGQSTTGAIQIVVADDRGRSDREADEPSYRNATSDNYSSNYVMSKEREMNMQHYKVTSMGDECIDLRGKDKEFNVQATRRSFSLDSSCDRQLYMAVQQILQQNPHFRGVKTSSTGEGSSSSSGNGSGRIRRSFFSSSRSSKISSVLPIHLASDT